MSRFLETLKEVSRSQEISPSVPGNGESEEKKPGGTVNLPVVDLPEVAGPAISVEKPAAEPRRDELPPLVAPRQNPFGNKNVHLRPDRKIPLMPNTVDHTIVEQYRKLRTKIQQQHATKPIRSLLIASPGPNEGKTITVMNLALSFAMLPDFKVLLIDGDLRKGTVAKWLGTESLPGLSNLIDGSAQAEDVVFQSEEFPLCFTVAGTSDRPSAELLTSPLLPAFIRRMTQQFDLVLVDSPPVNLLSDAQMLANSCDAILLVARAFSTTSKAFQKTLQELASFRVVGTVLNGGMRARNYQHYYGY
jgi:protein-tyrosine kinase